MSNFDYPEEEKWPQRHIENGTREIANDRMPIVENTYGPIQSTKRANVGPILAGDMGSQKVSSTSYGRRQFAGSVELQKPNTLTTAIVQERSGRGYATDAISDSALSMIQSGVSEQSNILSDTKGTKFDHDKPPMALLDAEFLEGVARVLGFGSAKYAAHNWRNGIAYSRLISAAYRHLGAINKGEDIDEESGLPHSYHLGCCVMFLASMMNHRPELDDRWKG